MLNFEDVLIIPDIHEKYKKVQKILDIYEPNVDYTIFLGDWFDKWGQTDLDSVKYTARLLGSSLMNPKRLVMFGNHDLPYFYTQVTGLQCSGNDFHKCSTITRELPEDYKNYLCSYVWINNWLCSHAGIHPTFAKDLTNEELETKLSQTHKECINALENGYMHAFVGAGRARGGGYPIGGITWLDFEREFQIVPNVSQIVGHTEGHRVRNKCMSQMNSENYCIDTSLNDIAILHGDLVEIIDVSEI